MSQPRAALGILRALRSAASASTWSAPSSSAPAAAAAPARLSFATKAAAAPPATKAAAAPPPATTAPAPKKDWSAVAIPAESAKVPTTVGGGQAFANDLRSTSGLGLGDGLSSHTAKWLQGAGPGLKSPMDWAREAEPIEVHANVVASTGGDDPALGCPVEYINLKGTTRDRPAVCKYTGAKYWAPKRYWAGSH